MSRRPRKNEQGERVFRIAANSGDFDAAASYFMRVPATVARMIGGDVEFTLELTEEGLLYRKTSGETKAQLPSWLTS